MLFNVKPSEYTYFGTGYMVPFGNVYFTINAMFVKDVLFILDGRKEMYYLTMHSTHFYVQLYGFGVY